MTREMKNSGIEWIGDIPSEWKIGRVKNAFTRKNKKAQQEEPTILSLARSGVKVRDVSTGEGQIAESYYNYNPVEPFDLLTLWTYTVVQIAVYPKSMALLVLPT